MTAPKTERLLRVVYFSRNAIGLPPEQAVWEIDQILETAQANNARCGITGALLFNDGAFVQVLEGPAPAVEEIFERIQMDDRHCEVTILQTEWVEERLFPDWSMGFAGMDAAAAVSYAGIAEQSCFDLGRLSGNDLIRLLGEIARRNEMATRAA